MRQTKDILGQEPEVKQVECIGDAEDYVVYISLDYLHTAFCDVGIQCDMNEQQKFIKEIQEEIADVLLRRSEKNVMFSWMWTDNKGCMCHAIEVVPTKKVHDMQIITPDVSCYNELRDIIEKQQRSISELQSAIDELRKENRRLSDRIDRSILDSVKTEEWL